MLGENLAISEEHISTGAAENPCELTNNSPQPAAQPVEIGSISFCKLFRGDIRAFPKQFRHRLHHRSDLDFPEDKQPIAWSQAGALSLTMWSSEWNSTFWIEVTPHTIDGLTPLFSYYSDPFKHQADAESFAAQLAGAQWPQPSLPLKVLRRYRTLVTGKWGAFRNACNSQDLDEHVSDYASSAGATEAARGHSKAVASDVSTKLSIVLACRNEKSFIADCLESILASDYPRELMEILVVDGMSDDGTREIVNRYCERFTFIKLLDNKQRTTPTAFNIGIGAASGELILIMGAHSTYASDYISRCVQLSNQTGAENVGGVMRPVARTAGLLAQAIALTLTHRFGVGNADFRCAASNEDPRLVDTVFGGCYRREVFDQLGLFNEELIFNQDMDFNLRLRRAGGRTLMDPRIVSYYRARSELKPFCKHNFRNGSWIILSSLYSKRIAFSSRHLVPFLFVCSLIASAAVGLFVPNLIVIVLAIVGAYLAAAFAASCQIAWRERESRYVLLMPVAFACSHVSYGVGSLWASFRTIFVRGLRIRALRRFSRAGASTQATA